MYHRRFLAGLLLALLMSLPGLSGAANNRIRTNPGTPVTFWDATQTPAPTVVFTLSGLAAGTGQYSARYNKGTGPQAFTWRWRCRVQMATAPAAGDVIEVYISTSDGTNADGQLGTTTSTFSSDKRRNLTMVGVLVMDQTAASVTMTASNTVDIKEQFFSLALWNATSVNLLTNVNVHGCTMTPMNQEIE
jgi:hypothetical protein